MFNLKTDVDLNRRQQSKQRNKDLSENETSGETRLLSEAPRETSPIQSPFLPDQLL